jgi:B12-binding domain/radical SAM domain protein
MAQESPDILHVFYGAQNKYSWSSIVAALEGTGILAAFNLKVELVREDVNSALEAALASNAEKHFFLFSINSFHAAKILDEIRSVKTFAVEREIARRFITLAGGPHVTARPEDVAKAGVDFAFVKEGEVALAEFFKEYYQHVTDNGDQPFVPNATPNCYFCDQATRAIHRTAETGFVNLDDYPAIAAENRMFRPIEITRGCPHGCKYCLTPKIFGRENRHRSLDNVLYWVKKAVELKYDKVWFTAPNAFAYGSKTREPNVDTLEKLLQGLHQIDGLDQVYFGTFPSEVRPEFVTDAVMDAVGPLVSNKSFVVGAQSGSPRMLKHISRGHTIEDVWNAVDRITSRGYNMDIDMIFGLPGETKDDAACDMAFIKDVLQNSRVKIHTHSFMPLPGTAFENEPPGEIDPDLNRILGEYARTGRVYGSHFEQVARAKMIKHNSE